MKSILIYGDSLTYGKVPNLAERYDRVMNFVGVLENEIGSEYRVIDEGLRARMLYGENGFFPERNGLTQFGPILGSHLPVDLVCIFLGTNDCNQKSDKSEEEIYQALNGYKEKVVAWCENLSIKKIPKILLITPPVVRGDQVLLQETMSYIFGSNAEEKSKKLKEIYKNFCNKENCLFFDASEVCETADGEGVHLDKENNILLGEALANKIKEYL